MGNYMRMLSGMNTDLHNHSHYDIPHSHENRVNESVPAGLSDKLQPYAKMYLDDTNEASTRMIKEVNQNLEKIEHTLHLLATERYEQDILLLKATELLSQFIELNGAIPGEELLKAAQDYVGIFQQ